jgi:exoribonuclease-2
MLTNRRRTVKTNCPQQPLVAFVDFVDFSYPCGYYVPMEPGTIVEYISRKEMVCAVVLGEKDAKVRMLTEHNREVSHGRNRLAHVADRRLDLRRGRDALVEKLHATAARRKQLENQIDVEDLWEVLHEEASWIDLQTMAEFCFDGEISSDHTSAVMRALLADRLYFKFDTERFFPNTPEQVARIAAQAAEDARKALIIEEGSRWIRNAMESDHPTLSPDKEEVVEILKSLHLFGKESPHYKVGKEILSRSGLDPKEGPFHLLIKLGIWTQDENLNLHRLGISDAFPPAVKKETDELIARETGARSCTGRKDLTHLPIFTIDGQGTLDYDDAITIEPKEKGFRLGIHITDVGHFVKKGGPLDEEALARAGSIYMPEKRIPMLPPALAEDLCSLREGEERLAITITADLDKSGSVVNYDVVPSVIRVTRQLTYYQANLLVREDPELAALYEIAQKLRAMRLKASALQLNLPEVNVWTDGQGEISVSRINRESPSRVMVSECMILANCLAARFFRDHRQATVYRSQQPPRQRLIDANGGSLYQNWMQRRFLSRLVLGLHPEAHAGLGLDAYVTLTSPLRKYLDLVTQRQMRGLFGMERLYTEEELTFITRAVEQPMSYISVLQKERTRYWILKYLEGLQEKEEEGLVLEKRRDKYVVLLTNYMMECALASNSGLELQPQETVLVKIDEVNARSDTLKVSVVRSPPAEE